MTLEQLRPTRPGRKDGSFTSPWTSHPSLPTFALREHQKAVPSWTLMHFLPGSGHRLQSSIISILNSNSGFHSTVSLRVNFYCLRFLSLIWKCWNQLTSCPRHFSSMGPVLFLHSSLCYLPHLLAPPHTQLLCKSLKLWRPLRPS